MKVNDCMTDVQTDERLTRAKKTLNYYISWSSFHRALPPPSSFAHLCGRSGTTVLGRALYAICTRLYFLKGENEMMRMIDLMLIASLVATGCGLVNSKTSGNGNVTATFSLTDTLGQADTTFAPGQNFYMTFLLINTSGKTVTYTSVDVPLINFEILQGDSVIGATVFAVSNIANPIPIKLLSGDTLWGECEAPIDLTTISPQHTLIHFTLTPGQYIAKATFPQITGANVSGASGAGFTVHQ
jgi:hypothetical protein